MPTDLYFWIGCVAMGLAAGWLAFATRDSCTQAFLAVERDIHDKLRRLRAPLGVYAVTGNHEFYGQTWATLLPATSMEHPPRRLWAAPTGWGLSWYI